MDIKKEGTKAASWSLIDKFLRRGVQFVLSIFLARLLMPGDFGVIAMAAIFVSWGEVFRDFGLGQALVHRQDVTEVQTSTIFYINIIMACAIAGIFCLIAPLAADFYDNRMIAWVIRISGLIFIINGFNVVQNSLLIKNLNYKINTFAGFIASILSGIVGVIFAYLGYGVWSLLIQSVLSAIISTLYIWHKSKWRPKREFNFLETKPLFKKGFGFMGQGLIDNVFSYLGTMVIGKMFSPGILGIYDRGNTLADMPNTTFVLPISRPLFPVFAKLQNDIANLKQYYLKILQTMNWGVILVAGIFLLCSDEIIICLFGQKWIQSSKYFFILSLIIPFCSNWSIITALWKGMGLVKKVNLITFAEKVLFVISIPALFISLEVYAYCILASHILANVVKAYMNTSVIGLSIFNQYREWAIEMVLILCAILLGSLINIGNVWISLIIKATSFLIYYLILSRLLRLEGYMSFKVRLASMLQILTPKKSIR